mmetsp:Transcript_44210/g.44861  ORF Transcript_44210/g.44861 Transcript_44210/m.44861 type:complete len:93 (+) Transcript_44210:212-490(+)
MRNTASIIDQLSLRFLQIASSTSSMSTSTSTNTNTSIVDQTTYQEPSNETSPLLPAHTAADLTTTTTTTTTTTSAKVIITTYGSCHIYKESL